MNKAELIDRVYNEHEGLTKKQTGAIVDSVVDALAEAIRSGGRFNYPGFGTFTVKDRAAREGRNPQTGKPIKIAASRTVTFKPAPAFKESLGKPKKGKKK